MDFLTFETEAQRHEFIAKEIEDDFMRNDKVCIAISGGSTPQRLFSYLGKTGVTSTKKQLHINWVDERMVPSSDARNNAQIAKQLWLSSEVNVDLFPVNTTLPLDESLSEYIRQLADSFHQIWLGMGEDGHIASIFPGHPRSTEKAFTCKHPTDGTTRISMSFETLSRARKLFLLINGQKKRDILEQNGDLPVHQLIRLADIKVLYVD